VVVFDSAHELLDSDFLRYTQLILAAAKTRVLESSTPYTSSPLPYHLTLSTATLPQSLTSYLSSSPSHKNIQILSSPHLHKLPQRLKMEHIDPPSGGLNSSILKKLREIWEAKSDAQVVVFCNRNTKVEELNGWLKGKGVECVAFGPGLAGGREFGSNRSLKAFLSPVATAQRFIASAAAATGDNEIMESSVADSTAGSPTPPAAISLKASPSTTPIPKVLITTSLLSRGLDFSQNVGHVFLIQPPRNQIDFLHRAGRTGRAGRKGTVVVFGDRTGGRGVGMKEMRALKGTVLKVKEQAKEGLKWSGEKRVSFGDSRSERRVH
jgi:ATP-dependent RNA helicase MRH4